MPLLIALLLAVTALTAAAPADACACGIALEASVSRERALVIDRGATEDIVVSLDLTADPGGRAAVVFPVPADPQVGAVAGGDPLDYLDEATAPRAAPSGGGEGATAGALPTGGVDVIGRGEVGGYDVARLRADDPAALGDWLTSNGYGLPAGAEPILQQYVDQHWRYVAVRLAPGAEGTLKPLNISFATPRLVYPMRLQQLAAEPANLSLYVLAGGPATVAGHGSTAYAGPVSELQPQPPAALRSLLHEGRFLTRITIDGASSQYTDDLAIRTAATERRGGGGPGWWVWTLGGLAVLGGIVLLNRKFIQN